MTTKAAPPRVLTAQQARALLGVNRQEWDGLTAGKTPVLPPIPVVPRKGVRRPYPRYMRADVVRLGRRGMCSVKPAGPAAEAETATGRAARGDDFAAQLKAIRKGAKPAAAKGAKR